MSDIRTRKKVKRELWRAFEVAKHDGNATAMSSIGRTLLDIDDTPDDDASADRDERITIVERIIIEHDASWQEHLTDEEQAQLRALRDAAERRRSGGARTPAASGGIRADVEAATPPPASDATSEGAAGVRPRMLDDDGPGHQAPWVDHETIDVGITRPVASDPQQTEDLLIGLTHAARAGRFRGW